MDLIMRNLLIDWSQLVKFKSASQLFLNSSYGFYFSVGTIWLTLYISVLLS